MKLKYYCLCFIIIIIDQITKILSIHKNIVIIPSILKFNYVENVGGAFGIGKRYIILLFSILIIIGIIIYLIKNKLTKYNNIPILMILSGSIGNLIDRIFRGYVIDFIEINFFNFPNFNISDICIVVGVVIIIIQLLKKLFEKNINE